MFCQYQLPQKIESVIEEAKRQLTKDTKEDFHEMFHSYYLLMCMFVYQMKKEDYQVYDSNHIVFITCRDLIENKLIPMDLELKIDFLCMLSAATRHQKCSKLISILGQIAHQVMNFCCHASLDSNLKVSKSAIAFLINMSVDGPDVEIFLGTDFFKALEKLMADPSKKSSIQQILIGMARNQDDILLEEILETHFISDWILMRTTEPDFVVGEGCYFFYEMLRKKNTEVVNRFFFSNKVLFEQFVRLLAEPHSNSSTALLASVVEDMFQIGENLEEKGCNWNPFTLLVVENDELMDIVSGLAEDKNKRIAVIFEEILRATKSHENQSKRKVHRQISW